MKTARHNAIVGTVGLAILALLFVSRWLNPERIYETYDFSAAVAALVGSNQDSYLSADYN